MASRSVLSPLNPQMQSTSTNKMLTKNRPTSTPKSSQNTTTPRSKMSQNTSTPMSKLTQNLSTPSSKISQSRFFEECTAQPSLPHQKPRHLSDLAMPSPVSTPGAEHLSDVSSCCSVDGSDSNRSSPVGSPASSCLSIPAVDMKKKYKDELWSAIRSDYRYLMGEEIIDTCRSTESDLSLESDDQGSSVPAVSFKDYMLQYNELNKWLGSVLQRTRDMCNCLSEKYVNRTYHVDMLNHLTSLKHFKEYAKQLMRSCPRLRDDISQHLKQVNEKWEALEKLLLPNAKQCDKKTMLSDMELDLDQLKQWVDDMVIRIRNWRLRPHWTRDDIIRQLESQMALQAQVESHSKVVRSVLSLCDRLTNEESDALHQKSCSDGEEGLDDRRRAVELRRQVVCIQEECNKIWLRSLEWQMTLEDAKNNGIHLRQELVGDEDQWDRSRLAGQRKQLMELATVPEDGPDFTDRDDLFYMNTRSLTGKDDAEIKENVENENTDEESFSGQDADHLVPSESYAFGLFTDACGRSLSDPFLNGDVDAKFRQSGVFRSPGNIDLGSSLKKDVDLSEGARSTTKADGGISREWSPGPLRRYGAIDLVAAFGKDTRETPVDVGYSSGSHSTEETDSSAKQDSFVWPPSQKCFIRKQDAKAELSSCDPSGVNVSLQMDPNSCAGCEAGTGYQGTEGIVFVMELGKLVADGGGAAKRPTDSATAMASSSHEPLDDLRDIPETEDEMSVELPLDEVPLMRSSDLNAEEASSSLLKKQVAKVPLRRSLRFAEDTSASDFDAQPSKLAVHRASPKKKIVPGRAVTTVLQLQQKGNTGAGDATDALKKRKTKCAVAATKFDMLSSSCYASSEGTESESDEMNQGVPDSKSSGRHPNARWGGSTSLCSSPIKDLAAEGAGGRSPLKRRMSESLDNILVSFSQGERCLRWNSDSAVYKHQKEAFPSPKIRRMSAFSSDLVMTGFLRDARSEDAARSTRRTKNRQQSYGRRQEAGQDIVAADLLASTEQVVPCSAEDLSMFVGQDDALDPSCDSLNSSMRAPTPDGSQTYSDYEKNAEEEMLWQEDAYYRDNSGVEDEDEDLGSHDSLSAYAGGRYMSHDAALLRHGCMDSDSDVEDFQHVLQESRRGLKFIESTICQDFNICESGMPHQDPATFNEPLATCKTSISCLQELIDALKSKNKLDNEIHQVNEIVSRWQQLESYLLALQQEALLVSDLQTELRGIGVELENLAKEVEFDKFDNIHQLEDALKTVKAVPFKISQKVNVRLNTLENAWYQFEAERGRLDSQSIEFTEQLGHLNQSSDALLKRCELDGHRLQSALFSWYKFIETEQELKALLLSDESVRAKTQAESVETLEVIQMDWALLDEKLQQLSSSYLDFVNLCSDSSKMALKQSVMVPSSQLQQLRQKNEEKMLKLLRKARTQRPLSQDMVDCEMPAENQNISRAMPLTLQRMDSSAAAAAPALITENMASLPGLSRPLKYVLPLALAFVVVSCLYGLFGDSWYELIGNPGLIFDPKLRHIRGPPPA